jgi:membrane protease YdiL (CAAX protease family)
LVSRPDEGQKTSATAEVLPANDPSTVEPLVRNSFGLWVQTSIVLALTLPIYGSHSLAYILVHLIATKPTFLFVCFGRVLSNGMDVVVVLAAIYLSGEPWSKFGIKMPTEWIDLFSSFLLYYAKLGVKYVGTFALYQVLLSLFGSSYVLNLSHRPATVYHTGGGVGVAAMFGCAMSAGLSEELIMRGYLIPRLERTLGSTWSSVVASAGLYALLHSYQGIFGVWNALLSGLVSGSFFALTRRLWPLVLAHGVSDFVVMLNSSV